MLAKFGRNKPAILALLSLCVLALILLATTILNTEWSTISPNDPIAYTTARNVVGGSSAPGAPLNIPPLFLYILYACLILIAIVVIYLEPRSVLTMLIASALIFAFFTYFEESIPRVQFEPFIAGELGVEATEIIDVPEPILVDAAPTWINNVVAVVLSLILALIAGSVVRSLIPKEQIEADLEPIEKVKFEVHKAVGYIEAGHDLRSAILRCYADMTNALYEQRGVLRKSTITAHEFETELVHIGLPAQPVQRLTRLFETVRYSTEELGIREQREAVDCLNAIVASITPRDSIAAAPLGTVPAT